MKCVSAVNEEYSTKFKEILELRSEPVAVKLVREGEEFPSGHPIPDKSITHCQSVMRARRGEKFMMPASMHICPTGAAFLGMADMPPNVASGEFHYAMGVMDTVEAVKRTIGGGTIVPGKIIGTVVCPLKDADFEPDVVIFTDIPERIYWFAPLYTAHTGGRVTYITSAFQSACLDVTSIPAVTGRPNLSVGCLGCRNNTDLATDELMIGIPGSLIGDMTATLEKYAADALQRVNRKG